MKKDTVSEVSRGFLLASAGMGTFFFVPLFADTLTESRVAIGLLFSFTALITLVAQPLFGHFSDQLRVRKPFIVVGILLNGLIYFGYPLASTILMLLFLRGLQGLTSSIYTPTTPAIIADATSPSERGQAMGKWNKYSSIGTLLGVLASGIIAYLTTSFALIFYFAGLMFVSSALLLQIRVEEPKISLIRELKMDIDRQSIQMSVPSGNPKLRCVYLFCLINVVVMIGSGSVYTFLSIYMQTSLHANMLLIGAYYFVEFCAQGLLFQWFGSLSDRVGRKPIVMLGTLLYAVVFAGYALVQNLYLFFLVCIGSGMKWAAFYAAGLSWVSDMAPESSRGRELGYYSGSHSAGWIIGPLVGGFLAEVYGIQILFVMAMTFPLLGLSLLIPLKETRPSSIVLKRSW